MLKKSYFILALSLVFVIALAACSKNSESNDEQSGQENNSSGEEVENSNSDETEKNDALQDGNEDKSLDDNDNKENSNTDKGEESMSRPTVIISTKKGDKELSDMKFELYPDKAPNTVANFLTLSKDGYYDGLIFHRIISDFMIQGGDPTGTGAGGPGYQIKGEFKNNGFENDIKHEKGVISMARSGDPNSAGSQFFICHGNPTYLDGEYAAFGKLLEGEDALDELASVNTNSQDRPEEECVITKITVELNGYDLPEVEKN